MSMIASDKEANTPSGPGLLESVWQYRWLVIVTTVLAAAVGFGASFLQTTLYEGEARLLLADPGTAGVFDEGDSVDATRYVRNQAELVTSTPVATRASEHLDGQIGVEDMLENLTATASADLDLITIYALAPTPEGAQEFANAVAQGYQDEVSAQVQETAESAVAELEESTTELETRISTLEEGIEEGGDNPVAQAERDAAVSQLITLQSRADQIAVDSALYGSGVELFEQAELPESPAQPQPFRNAAIAAVLGLLAISAFAWWRAEYTQSADRRQDPARVLQAPLLGVIPDFESVGITGAVPTQSAPQSVAAEAYQFVVASLEFALEEGGGTSVLVTSASPLDGKTTTAINLAVAAAQDGRRVMLVDADERMRGLTQMSGVAPEPGLTDLSHEDMPFDGCVVPWRLNSRVTLPFVPGGSKVSDSAGFFRTPAFRAAMRRITERADLVLLDSPPLLAVSDTSAIASQTDGIVIVVNRGTPLSQLEDLRERLAFIGTPLLGYVFNRGSSSGGYGYAYQAYGSDKNGSKNGDDKGRKQAGTAQASGR